MWLSSKELPHSAGNREQGGEAGGREGGKEGRQKEKKKKRSKDIKGHDYNHTGLFSDFFGTHDSYLA